MSNYKDENENDEVIEPISSIKTSNKPSSTPIPINTEKPIDKDATTPIPFWSKNPNIFFQYPYILEFFPIESMSYEQKLNAVSRSVIVLAILGFIFTHNFRLVIISIMTLFSIFVLYHFKEKEKIKSENGEHEPHEKKEGLESFISPGNIIVKEHSIPTDNVFDEPNASNPFGNVLIPDYEYNPNKKPAPPSFNSNINDEILKQAKKLVSELNPDQPDISDKLFRDLGEQYVFEQSLRQFTSNPSTTIPNDQTGFAEFAYGSMVSCKEGNLFACARNLPKYTNY
jgi:hypothetical protein